MRALCLDQIEEHAEFGKLAVRSARSLHAAGT